VRLRLVAAACLLLVLSGCKASLLVGVDANDHGGGTVRAVVSLDKQAQAIAGDLTGKLQVDDLTKAGWKIVGPTKVSGGDVQIVATKKFASAAGATQAVRELDGAKGLFKDFRLSQSRGLFRTTTKFSGTVDLRKGIDSFSDEQLTQQLGSPLGATPQEFAQRIGTALSDALPIKVGVALPGQLTSNAPLDTGSQAAWSPKLGERVELVASAKQWNTKVILLLAVGVLALGTALIVGLGRRRTPRP
jgi:hypothetical protein